MKSHLFLLLLFVLSATTASMGQTLVFPYKPSTGTPDGTTAAGNTAAARKQAALYNSKPAAEVNLLRPAEYNTETQPQGTGKPTTLNVEANEVHREVKPGKGQEFTGTWTEIGNFYYVQLSCDCDPTQMPGKPNLAGVMLVWHAESVCKKTGEQGVAYILVPYNTQAEAEAGAKALRAQGYKGAWHNATLHGASLSILKM